MKVENSRKMKGIGWPRSVASARFSQTMALNFSFQHQASPIDWQHYLTPQTFTWFGWHYGAIVNVIPPGTLVCHFFTDPWKYHFRVRSYTVSPYNRRLMQGMFAIAFLAALRIGELTCNTQKLQPNLIFLDQVAFVKTREGSITAINLTLKALQTQQSRRTGRYFYSPGTTSLPCFSFACLFKSKGFVSRTNVPLGGSFFNFTEFFHKGLSWFPSFLCFGCFRIQIS